MGVSWSARGPSAASTLSLGGPRSRAVLGQWTAAILHLALMAPEYASPACNRALQESMATGRPWWFRAEKSSRSGDAGSPGN
jgi:hypothetical protein